MPKIHRVPSPAAERDTALPMPYRAITRDDLAMVIREARKREGRWNEISIVVDWEANIFGFVDFATGEKIWAPILVVVSEIQPPVALPNVRYAGTWEFPLSLFQTAHELANTENGLMPLISFGPTVRQLKGKLFTADFCDLTIFILPPPYNTAVWNEGRASDTRLLDA